MFIENLLHITHYPKYLENISDPYKICAFMEFMFKWIYCYGMGLCMIRYFASYCVSNKPSKTCVSK